MEDNVIGDIFIRWYQNNGRDLPWRQTRDPYLIWISEVILQQTRVAQGLDYFNRFTERFPDVRSLAEAEEDEVMRYWQGLGYYSRARNLHAAAKDIMNRFQGEFPRTREEVLSLKGIGDYTAAAICSFAYRLPHATVDGNVYRVLARLFDIDIPVDSVEGKQYFTELVQRLLNTEHPDLFNQAIMEFGALQCVPKSPNCETCPLNDKCLAFARGKVRCLPVKHGKTVTKSRYFNYFHIHDSENRLLLQRRDSDDIWRNLYEFPLWETDHLVECNELESAPFWRTWFESVERVEIVREFRPKKHVLSHRIIHAVFYEVKVSNFSDVMSGFVKIPASSFGKYAVSRLMQIYWEQKPDDVSKQQKTLKLY